jgi:hypothetical protein
MSSIPLDLQRRFEQRWAAKVAPAGTSAAPKGVGVQDPVDGLSRPAEEKEEHAGLGQRRG